MRSAFVVLLLCPVLLAAQDERSLLNDHVSRIASLAEKSKTLDYSADLTVAGQRGENPGRVLSQVKVRYAVAPGGKFHLHLQPAGKDEYFLVSNGEKSWAYVPRLKQYTEEEAALRPDDGEDEQEEESAESDASRERDIAELFVKVILPALGEMVRNAEAADIADPVEVRYEGKKAKWPVVRVMSKESSPGSRRLTELAIDPATGRLGQLVIAEVSQDDNVRTVVRATLQFHRFSVGETPTPETFAFAPPRNAKLVDAVPIPGQSGSFLLNKPAPEFVAKTLDGREVRLSELRGTPVLLNFWASWCGPCRRELPELADLYDKHKGKDLLVLGVNDEGKSVARDFQKQTGLNFETLDDSSQKLYRAFRVRSIPTIFLIDKDGRIVRFASGARDKAGLQALLKSVGL